MADEKAADLAHLVSLLWQHGQRTVTRRSTAQAVSQGTKYPLATDQLQHWPEQIARTDRRLPEDSQPIKDCKDDDCTKFPTCGLCGREDDEFRIAALKRLQSSGYASLKRLPCEVTERVVIVHGVIASYFLKQMAQTVIQQLDGIKRVSNLVEVRGNVQTTGG